MRLELTDGAINSQTETAIEASSGLDLVLANTKVTGAAGGVTCDSRMKLKATKKTAIVSTKGNALTATSSADVNLNDALLKGAAKALKGTVSVKVKLAQGARVAGARGGIDVDGNLSLDATRATLEGGSGAALTAGYGGQVTFRQGTIKGTPAVLFKGKAGAYDVEGTKIEGEVTLPAR
jgi:hypothetical protein